MAQQSKKGPAKETAATTAAAHATGAPGAGAAMKLRVILRGLIWFHLDGKGALRVYLVNDADCHHADHFHIPRMACIGRDAANGHEVLGRSHSIAGQRIEFAGLRQNGVTEEPSYLRHVPWLREVYGTGFVPTAADRNWNLVAAEVIIPGGRIWTRRLISWTPRLTGVEAGEGPEHPARLGFFWHAGWDSRPMASECVLEAELAAGGLEVNALSPHLYSAGIPNRMLPLTGAAAYRHEVDPDVVDILITNLPARRSQRAPWSVHYQLLFWAAGFKDADYKPPYNAFESRANRFSPRLWADDRRMIKSNGAGGYQGVPFPHIVDAQGQPLPDNLNDPSGLCMGGRE